MRSDEILALAMFGLVGGLVGWAYKATRDRWLRDSPAAWARFAAERKLETSGTWPELRVFGTIGRSEVALQQHARPSRASRSRLVYPWVLTVSAPGTPIPLSISAHTVRDGSAVPQSVVDMRHDEAFDAFLIQGDRETAFRRLTPEARAALLGLKRDWRFPHFEKGILRISGESATASQVGDDLDRMLVLARLFAGDDADDEQEEEEEEEEDA